MSGVTLTASFNGVRTSPAAQDAGFRIGTSSSDLTFKTVYSSNLPYTASGQFSADVTGLEPSTTYYYQAFMTVSDRNGGYVEIVSEVGSFTTKAQGSVSNDYLTGFGMPDLSGLNPQIRSTGTYSDRDDKWYSYSTNNNNRQIAVHTYSEGAPNSAETLNYVVLYDGSKYAPLWTAHTMNSTYWPDNNAGRNESWTNDPAISLTQQTGLDNASTVGYSRGHLVASDYRQTSVKQNKQTFYYANQAPQWQDSFNGGIWNNLENRVKAATPSGTTMMYVITGVLYEGTITYKSSGSLSVPIPSHFYKCIMKCTFDGSGNVSGAQGIAFVYTNAAHSGNYYDDAYVTSIDAIETRAGFNFFAAVPESLQNSAEANTNHQWFSGVTSPSSVASPVRYR